jgi:hypothetical protein
MTSVRSLVACGVLLVILVSAGDAGAVQFTGTQTAPGEWTYTLTYDLNDNYSVCQASTTITLSGFVGVTQALAPTSTDFPNPGLDAINLLWTPQVLSGGTTVTWNHAGGGTGNFGIALHVFGFKVIAPGASTGTVTVATSGFALDGACPAPVLDISGSTAGPAAAQPIPTLGGKTVVLFVFALAAAGALLLRRV